MEHSLFVIDKIIWPCVGCFLLYLVIKFSIAIWWKPKQIAKCLEAQGITGPAYKLLVGNAFEFVKFTKEATSKPMILSHDIMARVIPYYRCWSEIYGSTFLTWLGTTPMLFVGRSELIKEVLGDKNRSYQKPPWDPVTTEFLGEGLVTLNGETWAKHRRIINPAFHMDKLKDMFSSMVESTVNMLEQWERVIQKGGTEVDVSHEFKVLTSDILARTAFGSSYLEGKQIFDMIAQQISISVEDSVKLMIPCYRFLPLKRNRDRWRLRRKIRSCLKQLILQREKAAKDTREAYGNDLLGCMVNTIHELQSADNSAGLTIDEIIEECKTFFFAGQETTMNFLTFVIVLLAMHPEWQEKARAEVLEVCGNCVPKFEALNKLKTLGMIMNEVIRLYPAVVAVIRQTSTDSILGGISIPAGTQIFFPILAMNHDTRLWGEDAKEFKPDRFSEGVSKAAIEDSAVFIPFGYGSRSCIGQNFAMVESKIAMAMILQRFSFSLSPSYIHAPTCFITIYAQFGAHILLHDLQSQTG